MDASVDNVADSARDPEAYRDEGLEGARPSGLARRLRAAAGIEAGCSSWEVDVAGRVRLGLRRRDWSVCVRDEGCFFVAGGGAEGCLVGEFVFDFGLVVVLRLVGELEADFDGDFWASGLDGESGLEAGPMLPRALLPGSGASGGVLWDRSTKDCECGLSD